ncbi:hypothetical protein [Dactylosporangium cerinum]
MRTLIAAGAGLRSTEHACVQILARPAAAGRVRAVRRAAVALRTGGSPTGGALDPLVWLRAGLDTLMMLLGAGGTRSTGHRAGGDPVRERDARPALDKAIGPRRSRSATRSPHRRPPASTATSWPAASA